MFVLNARPSIACTHLNISFAHICYFIAGIFTINSVVGAVYGWRGEAGRRRKLAAKAVPRRDLLPQHGRELIWCVTLFCFGLLVFPVAFSLVSTGKTGRRSGVQSPNRCHRKRSHPSDIYFSFLSFCAEPIISQYVTSEPQWIIVRMRVLFFLRIQFTWKHYFS